MSPLNYGRRPPRLGSKDAEALVTPAPVVPLTPASVAFLDHLAALTAVAEAGRLVVSCPSGGAIEALEFALAALDENHAVVGGDAA